MVSKICKTCWVLLLATRHLDSNIITVYRGYFVNFGALYADGNVAFYSTNREQNFRSPAVDFQTPKTEDETCTEKFVCSTDRTSAYIVMTLLKSIGQLHSQMQFAMSE